MNEKILKLLYRSFDDSLTPAEQQQLEEALAKSQELRKEKERIVTLRKTISSSAEGSFNPFFAEKVMRQLISLREEEKSQARFFESLFNVFRPIAIAATIILITLMAYNLFKSDRLSLSNAFAEPEVSLEQVLEPTLTFNLE